MDSPSKGIDSGQRSGDTADFVLLACARAPAPREGLGEPARSTTGEVERRLGKQVTSDREAAVVT